MDWAHVLAVAGWATFGVLSIVAAGAVADWLK